MTTRANGCLAYLSLKPVGTKRKAAIVRRNTKHTGHDFENEQQLHVNRLSPEVIGIIEGRTVQVTK